MPSGFVRVLRSTGVDAVHPEEQGNQRREDQFHWQQARDHKRVLVTCNGSHFWNDRWYPLKDSPGLVVVDAGGNQDWERVGILIYAFAQRLKNVVPALGGPRPLARSKIRLTNERIVCKYLDRSSQIALTEEAWGPYWS
jgi:predicted nuclease of predicted toxin-antitoxin system